MNKLTVGVLFGGRSTEHEVSIISGLQVIFNLSHEKYDVVPIYVTKSGAWIKGDSRFLDFSFYKDLNSIPERAHEFYFKDNTIFEKKTLLANVQMSTKSEKLDLVIPVFHGTFGEDGCVQGLLEMSGIPYTGCGVLASSIGMDKLAQKLVFAAAGIPQVKYNQTGEGLSFPVFVKPSNGGSSIGITKVRKTEELSDAIAVAKCYDRKVLIEESAEGYMEINISVLGNTGEELKTSVCEQPVPSKEVLTFEDKYQSGSGSKGMASAQRLIPAPIKAETAAKIKEYAKCAFEAIDGSGLARVDFLVSPDENTVYINEINTLPGSMAFYLWDKSGYSFPQLLDELIVLGRARFEQRNKSIFTFNSNILATIGESLKSGKIKS